MARINPGQWRNMGPDVRRAASYLNARQRDTLFNIWSGLTAPEAYDLAGGKIDSTNQYKHVYVNRIKNSPKGRAFLDALTKRHGETLEPEADKARTEQDERWAAAVMRRNEALAKLSHIARANIKDIADFRAVDMGVDDKGRPLVQSHWTIKQAEDMPEHVAAAIKKVKATPSGIELELHDPIAAIQQIGKMMEWESPQRIEGRLDVDVAAPEIAAALKTVLDKL